MSQEEQKDIRIPEDFLNPDGAAITGASANPSTSPDPSQAELPAPEPPYAGFWIRVGATVIDTLFLVGVSMLIFNPLRRALGYGDAAISPIDAIELIFNFLYVILLTWWTGQTLGKMVTGIRVIDARQTGTNSKLTLGQVVLREVVGKLLASLPIGLGYLWVIWSDKKRGWHDMIAKTYVIRVR